MGLFNLFKNKKPDNFGLISYNTAYIYYYLKWKHDKVPEFWDRVMMAGTIDAIQYIMNNQIPTSDLVQCQNHSQINQVMNESYTVRRCSDEQQKFLVLFIMNLQCLMFLADTNMSPTQIRNSVIKKGMSTTEWVLKAYNETKTGEFDNIPLNNHIESVLYSMVEGEE